MGDIKVRRDEYDVDEDAGRRDVYDVDEDAGGVDDIK